MGICSVPVVGRTWPILRRPSTLVRPRAVVMHPQAAVDSLKPQHITVARSHPPQRPPHQLLQQLERKLGRMPASTLRRAWKVTWVCDAVSCAGMI